MKAPVDPLRDRELTELLSDDAELLAIADAIAATAPRRGRRRLAVVALAAATVCAGVAVAPALGVHLGHAVAFWAAPSAPRGAFPKDPLLGRSIRGLKVAQARSVGVESFQGETMRLFVAPVRGGGFCYEWAVEPGVASVWLDELGGCGNPDRPLSVSFDDTRLSIVADARRITGVLLTLSDGRVVEPDVHWVSAPVRAGFILYQPPAHLQVTVVHGIRDGEVVATRPLSDAPLNFVPR